MRRTVREFIGMEKVYQQNNGPYILVQPFFLFKGCAALCPRQRNIVHILFFTDGLVYPKVRRHKTNNRAACEKGRHAKVLSYRGRYFCHAMQCTIKIHKKLAGENLKNNKVRSASFNGALEV